MCHSILTKTSGATYDAFDWQAVVSECEPRIAAWCRRFGLQDADAADVSQNVLLKFMISQQSGNFDTSKGHFLCWLKVVTNNTIKTLLWRRNSRREFDGSEAADAILECSRSSSTESTTDDDAVKEEESLNQQLQQAELCVKPRIKQETWEAYQLTMHENLSPSATAARIGISVRDVYVAKCRVIGYLKRELGF